MPSKGRLNILAGLLVLLAGVAGAKAQESPAQMEQDHLTKLNGVAVTKGWNPNICASGDCQIMNSNSSAIVSVVGGQFYSDTSWLPERRVSQFAAGQHFCMTDAALGTDGYVEVPTKNGHFISARSDSSYPPGVSFLYARDDGSFKPDTTKGPCQTVAGTSSEMATDTFDLVPPAPLSYAEANDIVLVVFGFFIAWHVVGSWWAERPSSRANLWRTNKEDYNFNERTGEWSRILRHSGAGAVVIDGRSRSERIANEFKKKLQIWGLALTVEGTTLGMWYLNQLFAGELLIFTLFCACFSLWPIIWQFRYNWGLGGSLVIDPPRQETPQNPFGPHSATSALHHPAQDDLAYKPNSYDANYSKGDGLSTQTAAAVCLSCSGSRLQSCTCTGGRVLCSGCGGSGRKWINAGWGQGHDETCSLCDGRGYSECPACRGTGKFTCKSCNGRG